MEQNYFLSKWLSNEITEEELGNHLSATEIAAYKKIISATNQLEVPEYNPEEALKKIKLKHNKPKAGKLHFMSRIYRIAAILTLLLLSYYFISDKEKTYATQFAEKISFDLPDKSNVRLNADSEITFKTKNWKRNKVLNLKGEAFFSVFKGTTFTVNTALGTVTVLGTKFNVVVRENYFEVNCYEGIVSTNYQNKTIEVPAGSSFKVLNNVSEFGKINATNPSWIENKSSFKSMPYKYVVQEIERQYNITVVYDAKNAESLFTGNFTHTNLDMALKAISIPLNLKYTEISDKKVLLQEQ